MFQRIGKRWLMLVTLTAVVAMVVAACGGDADPTEAPAPPTAPPTATPIPAATATPEPPNLDRYGGTISWAWCCPNLPNLDPHFGNHMTAQSVSPAYNHLTKLVSGDTPNDVTVELDLAEDLTFSSDGLTMTFTLREGVKFHDIDPANGRVITAQDVKWNLERLAFEEASSYKSTYRNVDSFDAPDATTLVINLSVIDTLMPFAMAGREAYIAAPETPDLKVQTIGTGPFVLNRWEKDVGVFLDRNPEYFKVDAAGAALPYADSTESLIIPDRAARTAALISGQLSYLEYVFTDEAGQVNSAVPDIQQETYRWQSSYVVYFNFNDPMFQDVRVRRAIALGMDIDAHIAVAFGGDAVWAGPISGQHGSAWAFTPEELAQEKYYYRYNVDEAKALLAEAGIPEGFELHVDSVEFQRDYSSQAELFVTEMEALGFNVVHNVEPDFGSFIQHSRSVSYKHLAWGFDGQNAPLAWLVNNYRSDGAKNASGLVDASLDAAIDDILTTIDVSEQQRKAKELQDRILQEVLVSSRVADSNTHAFAQANVRSDEFGRYRTQPIETYVRDHENIWFEN